MKRVSGMTCCDCAEEVSASIATDPSARRTAAIELMQRVNEAHERSSLRVKSHAPALPEEYVLQDAERHCLQRLSIVNTLKREGLASPMHSIVEFGAGNGALSREVWLACAGGSFLLVDRSPKRAAQQMRASTHADGFQPTAMCADISLLDAADLRDASRRDGQQTVMLCNHLCGSALDDAIRKSVEAWHATSPGSLAGVVAVTCCHDSCTWDSYLGKQFLSWLGFSAADFEQAVVMLSPRRSPRRAHAHTRTHTRTDAQVHTRTHRHVQYAHTHAHVVHTDSQEHSRTQTRAVRMYIKTQRCAHVRTRRKHAPQARTASTDHKHAPRARALNTRRSAHRTRVHVHKARAHTTCTHNMGAHAVYGCTHTHPLI